MVPSRMLHIQSFAAKKEAAEKVAGKLREQHNAAQAAVKKSHPVLEEALGPAAEATSGTPQAAQVASLKQYCLPLCGCVSPETSARFTQSSIRNHHCFLILQLFST